MTRREYLERLNNIEFYKLACKQFGVAERLDEELDIETVILTISEMERACKEVSKQANDRDWHFYPPCEDGKYFVLTDNAVATTDTFKDGKWQSYGEHVKAWIKIIIPEWFTNL